MASSLRAFMLAAILASSSPAFAQTMMSTSTLDLGIMQTQQNSFLFQSMNSANAGRDAAYGGSSGRSQASPRWSGPGPARRGAPVRLASTRFRPVAPSIVPHRLALQFGRDAAHRAVLENYFATTLRDYGDLLRRRGGPPNDVARAASFVVATSYDTLQGRDTLGVPEMTALRAQMAAEFPKDARFQAFDDRRKQELYENFVILGMHMGGLLLRANQTHDEELRRVAQRMASRQLENMFGVPANRIRIDRSGLSY